MKRKVIIYMNACVFCVSIQVDDTIACGNIPPLIHYRHTLDSIRKNTYIHGRNCIITIFIYIHILYTYWDIFIYIFLYINIYHATPLTRKTRKNIN